MPNDSDQQVRLWEFLKGAGFPNLDPKLWQVLAALADLKILCPSKELPERIGEGKPRHVSFEVVQLDYAQTCEQIKMLTDIRFKLLAFVPPIVGASVALLSSNNLSTAATSLITTLGIGALGFTLTLAAVLYDIRNSQLYNAHMHRAKVLEGLLCCISTGGEKMWSPPSISGGKTFEQDEPKTPPTWQFGGVHTQRAISLGSILGFSISHGSALSLVYGVALGAWLFPVLRSASVSVGLFAKYCCLPSSAWLNGSGFVTSSASFLATIAGTIYFYSKLRSEDRGR